MSTAAKFKLYLDLEWIFNRFATELSIHYYSSVQHPQRRDTLGFLKTRIRESDTVLDLGCKAGDMSVALGALAAQVVGVDHDRKAIEVAREKYTDPKLEFHHADALEFLRERGRRFDVLVLSHILEHLDDPRLFLESFTQWFTYIYIELPDFDKIYLNHYRKDLKMDLIYTDADHTFEFDRFELKALLESCGIEIIDAEYRFGIQRIWCRVGS